MIKIIVISVVSTLIVVSIVFFMGSRTYHKNVKLGRGIQQKYWTTNPDEKSNLLKKGIDYLSWEESLRLLHLTCLEILSEGPGKEQLTLKEISEKDPMGLPPGKNRDLILLLFTRLCSDASPYQPRTVDVQQSERGKPGKGESDIKGIIRNASLTHLGCIEVFRLNDKNQPNELSFIPFNELHQIVFKTGGLCRVAEFEFMDGRPKEELLVPLQYGISWITPNTFDHDGSFTRFICHIDSEQHKLPIQIGVGHQDFWVESGEGTSLLGLGSIIKLSFIHSG